MTAKPFSARRALTLLAFAALTAAPTLRADTLVPPNDGNYSRGRAVAISGGTALVASAPNTNVLTSAVYLYHGLDTATGAVAQSAQLTSADGQAGQFDNFGISMALSGGLGLVGAPNFSNGGVRPKVYVYRNLDTASGTVTENAQLVPSDSTASNSAFGFGVSLSGTSGLVGAYLAGSNAGGGLSGEAYLFRNLNTATGTVNENVRLLPSDAASIGITPRFGLAVSLSGNTGLVGANQATTNGNTQQGAAYVFRNLDTATGTVTENVKLTASDGAASNQFGFAVSQSGNTALVGAYRATVGSNALQGAAYVFRNLDTATGTVTQNVKLTASDGVASSVFGYSVAQSGNVALVGAPQSVNGNVNSNTTVPGAAYLFRNLDTATGTVTQNVKLTASDGAANDHFGFAVSVDGDRFLISAPQNQTSQAGKSYSGSLGSVSTLDLGNTSKIISGVSFVSQDNWVIGQNTSGNQVTLSAGDTANVTATGKGVFIGQNAGSNNNTLVLAGTVAANTVTIGNPAGTTTGNTLQLGNGGTTGSLPTTTAISNSGILAFNRSNAVVQGTDFSGAALTGSGGVTQLGTGTLTLTAANTYTGGTTINAGALTVASNNGLGTGNVTLAASTRLTLNTGVVVTNMTGATLTLTNTATSNVALMGIGVQDTVSMLVIGGVTQLAGTYGAPGSGALFTNQPDFTGTGELLVTSGPGAVPEPSTWSLLGVGAGLLGAGVLRRRQRAMA